MKNKSASFKLYVAIPWLILAFLLNIFNVQGTNYYSATTGNANSTGTWWTNSDGTGSNPANFTSSGDIFHLQSSSTLGLNGNWTIGTTTGGGTWDLNIDGTININGFTVSAQNNNTDPQSTTTINVNSTGIIAFDESGLLTSATTGGTVSNRSFNLNSGATLKTKNTGGISGSVVTTNLTAVFDDGANYEFNGSTQSTTGLPSTVNNLIISGSGTKTLNGAKIVSGDFTIGAGAKLDVSSSNYDIDLAGNWTNNDGIFIPRSGTVTFNGASTTQTLTGNSTFYNLVISGTGSTVDFGSTITIIANIFSRTSGTAMEPGTSKIVFTGASGMITGGSAKTFNNIEISSEASISTQSSSGNVSIYGSYTNDGAFNMSGITTYFKGSSQSLSGAGTTTFGYLTVQGKSTVNSGAHEIIINNGTFASTGTFNGDEATVTFSGTSLLGSNSGEYNFNNITINGSLSNAVNSKNFNLTGDWINNGTYTKGTETIEFNGSTAQTLGGTSSTVFNNLTFTGAGNKAIASGAIVECNDITIESGATLTIASTAANATGSLKITGSATVDGTVEVQRYLSSNNWHIISSPVSAQQLGSFVTGNSIVYNSTAGDYDLAPYDEGSDGWTPYTASGNTNTFTAGKGYVTRRTATGTVTFTSGTINTGSPTVEIKRNNFGWNCVGNPYTTAIAIKGFGSASFLDYNKTKLDQEFAGVYIWDQSIPDYVVITQNPFKESDFQGGENEINPDQDNIAISQGFIIKAAASGTVDFLTTMQVSEPTTLFKSAEISSPAVRLNVSTGDMINKTVVSFMDGMIKGLDPTYDVGKLKGNPDLALYTRLADGSSNVDFAVQVLPDLSAEEIYVPVGLDYPAGGEVTFTLETSVGFQPWTNVYLEDTQLETLTKLNEENGVYSTTVAEGTKGTGRFNLVFANYTATGIDKPAKVKRFSVFTQDRVLFVNGPATSETRFAIYSVDGKLWYKVNARQANQNRIETSRLPAGVYILKIEHLGKLAKPVKFVLH